MTASDGVYLFIALPSYLMKEIIRHLAASSLIKTLGRSDFAAETIMNYQERSRICFYSSWAKEARGQAQRG